MIRHKEKRVRSRFWRKYHKWLGIILTVFILLFAVSGIVMNHRNFFSPINVARKYLPASYQYYNWNNAAIKGSLKANEDKVLFYGNIGIWITDPSFSKFEDFNTGFPQGIDHRKVNKVAQWFPGEYYAATLFGLYHYSLDSDVWEKISLPGDEENIQDLVLHKDRLLILSRNHLFVLTKDGAITRKPLPAPEGYDNKISLFRSLWTLHSGELFGFIGMLFVDFLGLVFIFLSLTGILYFLFPGWIKRRKARSKDITIIKQSRKWTLKWHNNIGWTLALFLVITTISGMFLRPPLLISIANVSVGKLPYTSLDDPNPWFDKLRRIVFDPYKDRFLIASLDGIYEISSDLQSIPRPFLQQAPASVMGVTVFEWHPSGMLLIGSFEGLFLWDPASGYTHDYIENQPFLGKINRGIPVGQHLVSGYTKDLNGIEVFFDYDKGSAVIGTDQRLPLMPPLIQEQPMSLWNLALEVHTARIYQSITGIFYILIIPLVGIGILFILVSGFILWIRHHRKKPSSN